MSVKTTQKYHKDRVSLLERTWAADERIDTLFMTDDLLTDGLQDDPRFVDVGVNTESGHCGKLSAILRYLNGANITRTYDFYVISDDDTLWNIDALLRLLRNTDQSAMVYMGERYAFASDNVNYEYITTGGGLVLSKSALALAAAKFLCNRDNSYDDMALGQFFAFSKEPEVPCTHSSQFHQRRPVDYPGYSSGFAQEAPAISFHNVFHSKDPAVDIYDKFLKSSVVHDLSSDMVYA